MGDSTLCERASNCADLKRISGLCLGLSLNSQLPRALRAYRKPPNSRMVPG